MEFTLCSILPIFSEYLDYHSLRQLSRTCTTIFESKLCDDIHMFSDDVFSKLEEWVRIHDPECVIINEEKFFREVETRKEIMNLEIFNRINKLCEHLEKHHTKLERTVKYNRYLSFLEGRESFPDEFLNFTELVPSKYWANSVISDKNFGKLRSLLGVQPHSSMELSDRITDEMCNILQTFRSDKLNSELEKHNIPKTPTNTADKTIFGIDNNTVTIVTMRLPVVNELKVYSESHYINIRIEPIDLFEGRFSNPVRKYKVLLSL